MQSLPQLHKEDWRERLSGLLDNLYAAAAATPSAPDWAGEKFLYSISVIFDECCQLIRHYEAIQAALPYTIAAYSDENYELIIAVGNLPDHPETLPGRDSEPADRISVAMYVDGSEAATKQVLKYADELVEALGYKGPIDEQVEHGSIFRRYFAALGKGLSSQEVKDRLAKAERAIELLAIDSRQAQVDQQIASAVTGLVSAFSDVSSACVRIGSILFVKYSTSSGPVVLVRTLSQTEIVAIERFPEIQRDPLKALESLALAIADIDQSSGSGSL